MKEVEGSTPTVSRLEQMVASLEAGLRTEAGSIFSETATLMQEADAGRFVVNKDASTDELALQAQTVGDLGSRSYALRVRAEAAMEGLEAYFVGSGLEGSNELARKAALIAHKLTDPHYPQLVTTSRDLGCISGLAERAATACGRLVSLRTAGIAAGLTVD